MQNLQMTFLALAILSWILSQLTIILGFGDNPIERANTGLLGAMASALISIALHFIG